MENNNIITPKKVDVRKAIKNMLSRHHGFNQSHNFNPGDIRVSEIVVVGDSEKQYLYALVTNSSKSRLTGILFDSKKKTFVELFSVTKTVGTITVESFKEFYSIKGDVLTGKDFITGEEFSATISQTSTGMILARFSPEPPAETEEVAAGTELPVTAAAEVVA